MMVKVLKMLPLEMKQRGLVKLLAAKPSAEVLAANPMPEVGASIIDAHLCSACLPAAFFLFSCEAYLIVIAFKSSSHTGRCPTPSMIMTLWKTNLTSILGRPQELAYCQEGRHWKSVSWHLESLHLWSEVQGFQMCPNCRSVSRQRQAKRRAIKQRAE